MATITPLEAVGLALLALGLGGFASLVLALLDERGKPGHDHEEGAGGPNCPRCLFDREQRAGR